MTSFDPTSPVKPASGQIGLEEQAELSKIVEEEGQASLTPVEPVPLPIPIPTGTPIPPTPQIPPIPIPKAPIPIPIPFPPRPLPVNGVSGRYKYNSGWQLELRVDVDGLHPMNMVSGDFSNTTGGTTSYFGSFKSDPVSISVTATAIVINAMGKFTWSAACPKIRVTIPRTTIFQPLAPATLQFFSTSGASGATYVCTFFARNFRSVILEQDREQNVIPTFSSYNTGSLPSGGSARVLTIPAAYAEAGVDMALSAATDVVPTAEAGPDLVWSNAELHAAMVKHFSLWKDLPQWVVWLFHAYKHEMGTGLYGIMFDQQGKQRQGCAVFYVGIGGATADKQRLQLYTCVHELGHCFNLLHSWQKSYAQPPAPNRPSALSWMNYPWYYPGGAAPFWNAFAFNFDDLELQHIRHGFRNDVIMGGNDFTVGSALQAVQEPNAFEDPIEDNSGLKLELQENNTTFSLGEPVVVELKLSSTDTRGKTANKLLHPKAGFVQIAIKKPSGIVQIYKPLIEECMLPATTVLNQENPAVYESAYIGYGKDGLYFDQPGTYSVKAQYFALDGSAIVSNVLKITVNAPLNKADQELAKLFMGNEQGTLFFLVGSDSDALKDGNDAFETAVKKYPDHPLTIYAKFALGYNKGRAFKTITDDKKITVRKADPDVCEKMLSPVIEASAAGKGLDNISLNMTMRHLATVQKAAKDANGAKATMKKMVDIFKAKKLNAAVMQTIEAQAKQTLE